MAAASVGDPTLAHVGAAIVDFGRDDAEAVVDALLRFEPDLVGFSV